MFLQPTRSECLIGWGAARTNPPHKLNGLFACYHSKSFDFSEHVQHYHISMLRLSMLWQEEGQGFSKSIVVCFLSPLLSVTVLILDLVLFSFLFFHILVLILALVLNLVLVLILVLVLVFYFLS